MTVELADLFDGLTITDLPIAPSRCRRARQLSGDDDWCPVPYEY